MIAGIVVLCAVRLLCSDGVAAQNQACVPNHELECFAPTDHLNASGLVSVEVCVGKNLIISLQHFSEQPVCSWIRGADTVITVNGSESLVLPKLSEADSGEYTLRCETSDGDSSSMNVSLKVFMNRPSKPKLTIDKDDIRFISPSLTCISEDCPQPTLKWTGDKDGKVVSANSGRAQVVISTRDYSERGVMCCATNARGQECSQLYDYDLNSEFMKDDEVSNLTVSPGEPLLLRCRATQAYRRIELGWEKDRKKLDIGTNGCSSKVKREICIKSDIHGRSWMRYLFIESASSNHSGTYTCRTPNNNNTKSVNIQVQAEGFLSVQLNKSKIIPAHDASGSCLQASVSYHPVLEKCYWETPDKTEIECKKKTWVTKHRTVKLCVPLKSGDYKLHVEAGGLKETKTISVCVADRPSKPKLTIDKDDIRFISPSLTCISEDCPQPTLKWTGNKDGKVVSANSGRAQIVISTSEYSERGVMCCATNARGQECSQLYDYDLNSEFMKDDEVSNLTVSPGEPLLLRCRATQAYRRIELGWEKDRKKLDIETNGCSSKVKREICIKSDIHGRSWMRYLFIESASSNHSGTYTCRTPNNNNKKSVNIQVQAEGFLSVQLNKSKILPAHDASGSCLQASVSYHPVLEKCYWETPDKTEIECKKKTWVTKHRTVKLCATLKSGDYKLHVEAGGLKETKTISVCVADPPKFRFEDINNTFTFKTVALVPANYTWKSCVFSNDSCETVFNWRDIPGASDTVSDVSCQKTIRSSLSRSLVTGNNLWFCLTNSLGSWCQHRYIIGNRGLDNKGPRTGMSSGAAPNVDGKSMLMLKVGSLFLVMALAVVSVVLIYFVKKKKPQYQPQLQMIQMVGPNDNDYIYINFKDFGYDKQWEFPRENLELGPELGSGAFGTVVQATAYGINKAGVSQQVAVKMLKEKHQTVEKEALMSELKMLTHIGHHANIVNLLGACTDSGPTYLIFQYCCYGDLLNYLKTNRELYHKSVTDAFTKDRFSSIYHNLQPNKSSSEVDKAADHYMPMHRFTTGGQEDIALLPINLNNSIEEPLIYEDPDDLTEDSQTLTFDDLLSFAFQVAKGMEFLSSKNCIHRDLAARNVLVTKGRMAKIGDFGLARDIDNDSNYVVRGNVRLPVKWMAPESTFQGIYTMKSDVWAYGILLWEIFSLGVTPYPGMKVDHAFYSMIERGFKMECPYYANESVYGMMCKCWALDACDRPSFSKLVSFMCDQLTDREEQLYHNMPDQESSIYQNAAPILDISALTQQNENKAANDYCRTHATEESKAEVSETVAAEEKLKTSDAE